MDFEWDPSKSERCQRERGFDFVFAARIFDGPVVETADDRVPYGEVRVKALGIVDGLAILAVIYTDRAGARRIISARRANRKERAQWLWSA